MKVRVAAGKAGGESPVRKPTRATNETNARPTKSAHNQRDQAAPTLTTTYDNRRATPMTNETNIHALGHLWLECRLAFCRYIDVSCDFFIFAGFEPKKSPSKLLLRKLHKLEGLAVALLMRTQQLLKFFLKTCPINTSALYTTCNENWMKKY